MIKGDAEEKKMIIELPATKRHGVREKETEVIKSINKEIKKESGK